MQGIVILADGDYPTHPTPLSILQHATRLYCCDHAGLAALQHGLHPTAIVGDGDSLTPQQRQQLGTLYHHVSEQDDNDLTKTLRYALSQNNSSLLTPHSSLENNSSLPTPNYKLSTINSQLTEVSFLGLTGKREDHTLANIALMMRYYRHLHIRPTLYTDHGRFLCACGRTTFRSFPRQQVSIFNFGCTRLRSEGLRWQSYPYAELWQGTLNEATGTQFTLDGDHDYLVFLTYEPKK